MCGRKVHVESKVEMIPVTRAETANHIKVKVTLVQALRLCTGRTILRGSRGIALLFL
jgi:hypothetical protein